jgi:large subunit ribosomal protein L1
MYNNTLDALNQIKNDCRTKFDSTVELHINLNLDVKKADQMIRFSIVLPKGTGKTIKIATFSTTPYSEADVNLSEEDLDLIISGKIKVGNDFDVLITEPSLMPKVSKVARVLGPAGVMPNPKNGTVTTDIKKAIEQLKKGKVEIRNEQNHPIIHTIVGKCSFDSKDLEANLNEIFSNLKSNKPAKAKPDWIKSIYLSSTMGISYQLDSKVLTSN